MSEPRDPGALMQRGRELQMERKVAEAVSAYLDAALVFLFDQADAPSARVALSAAYNLDPQNLDVIYNMGRADVLEGRVQEALAKFIDVLRKSNVQHLPALFEAGCVYEALNQNDQAMLAFKRILDRNPMHIEATIHMGHIHEARGAKHDAVALYLQAAEIAREYRQYATARKVTNMVFAIDAHNQKAGYILRELDEGDLNTDEPMPPIEATLAQVGQRHTPVTSNVSPPKPAAPTAYGGSAAAKAPPTANEAELESKRTGLGTDIERLTLERTNLEATLTQERGLIEAALRRKSQLNTEIAHAQSSLARHETEVITSESRRKTDIEAQVRQLNSALQDVQAQTAAAKADLELVRAERLALEQTIQKLRGDIATMAQSKVDEEGAASAEREKSRTELDAMQKQAAEAKVELEDARAQFERNVSVWEERISRLRDEIGQLEAQRAKILKSSRA